MTRIYAPDKCQCPTVKEDHLEQLITRAIQAEIRRLVDVKAVIDAARQIKTTSGAQNEYTLALNKAEKEKERLMDAEFRLYDNFQSGLLQEAEYRRYKDRYGQEIALQQSKIEKLNQSLLELKEARQQDDAFVAFFQKYGNIQKLDRDVLNNLVKKIVFHEKNHIEIYFRFAEESDKLYDLATVVQDDGIVSCV